MRILGIETSCDETGVAIIQAEENDQTVQLVANKLASSLTLHAKTGGIIPETAAREQVRYIIPTLKEVLNKVHPESIDAIAVTVGPGLIGSLLVGIETAKTLAYVWKKPIIPVNHLIGHIYANWINCHPELACPSVVPPLAGRRRVSVSRSEQKEIADQVRNDKKIQFPALALVVSGGHTDLVLLKNHGSIRWLGGTRDDAAGEAFDKIGRLLGLPYPGGPAIEKASERGDASRFKFPRPMIESDDFDFSFSGLKTAVLREVQHHSVILRSKTEESPAEEILRRKTSQDDNLINDISASVQQAVIDVLVKKTLKAAKQYNVRSILLSGGVAANQKLRDEIELSARRYKPDAKIFVPQKFLCTDNGAMIASAAFFNYKPVPWQKITANPELYFDSPRINT